MKVLVTGANGLLGTDLVPVLSKGHEVVAAGRNDLDVTDLPLLTAALERHRPDAVVNCAAYSNVDGAETAVEEAFRVNGIGPKNVAITTSRAGVRLVHISTDYVFDGLAGRPYVEYDTPHPVGVYGRSKWMGEAFVREVGSNVTIVRTQALYGRSGRSFVDAILARVSRDEPLSVVTDQVVSPTRAADLSVAIARILDEGTAGTYHASSRGECSWFDFAKAILEETGRPDHPLSPIVSSELDRPAPRPPYSVLRNLHLEVTIGDTLPHWRDALSTHLEGR